MIEKLVQKFQESLPERLHFYSPVSSSSSATIASSSDSVTVYVDNHKVNMETTKRKRRQMHTVGATDFETEPFPHIPVSTIVQDGQVDTIIEDSKDTTSGLQGDYQNIVLLMFLYILQGIPLGLGGSIPMLLQSRSVSYKDQAIFSFVFWPFSIKLLWAPLVDALYFKWFGRRKTWLVPIQYLIGVFMIILSGHVDSLVGKENSANVNIWTLTIIFFMLNFLAATQDIAVDGWALTMLSRLVYSDS